MKIQEDDISLRNGGKEEPIGPESNASPSTKDMAQQTVVKAHSGIFQCRAMKNAEEYEHSTIHHGIEFTSKNAKWAKTKTVTSAAAVPIGF